MTTPSSLGLIGLAVMGKNFARNFANNGITISVYNRTTDVTEEFIREYGTDRLIGTKTIPEFIASLARPRQIILLVKAGDAVDAVVRELAPHLEPGDTIIDCGNSFYRDTQRRTRELAEKNIHFVGCGISGGEEGALAGPSIMPGGTAETWKRLKPLFSKVAAKDFAGKPCVSHIGSDGAGHYVKMVHNGIEYGIMQLIAEAYDYLRVVHKLKAPAIRDIFMELGAGRLNSYLFDITATVLDQRDTLTKGYLIDHIRDTAGNKGTGKWTSADSLDRGISLPTITEAVFARYSSSDKSLRATLAKLYHPVRSGKKMSPKKLAAMLDGALYAAIISTYAQGFHLMKQTASNEGWSLNFAEITRIWQGGCIIRADILQTISEAYKTSGKKIPHLFAIPSIHKQLRTTHSTLRQFVSMAALSGTPIPAFSTALSYIEQMTQEASSANMIQALRDCFGAHTYERTDQSGVFHTDWLGTESR